MADFEIAFMPGQPSLVVGVYQHIEGVSRNLILDAVVKIFSAILVGIGGKP